MELPTDAKISSHRPVLGPFIVLYKKLVGIFVQPYLRHIFEARNKELEKSFFALSQQVRHLSHELERREGLGTEKRPTPEGAGSSMDELELSRSRLTAMVTEARTRVKAHSSPSLTAVGNAVPYDEQYAAFQDRFRGSREDVMERQAEYIPTLKQTAETLCSPEAYFLDVGCGRGELLELLARKSVPARGIDLNPTNIALCREKDFLASQADCFSFLKSLADSSLLGVVSLQLIEHLTSDQLEEFVRLSFSKTMPGGKLVLETINPLSLYAMKTFCLDTTHQKPVHPQTLRFLVESAGFRNVELKFLAPVPEHIRLDPKGDENMAKLDDFLFGCRDYAVLADR